MYVAFVYDHKYIKNDRDFYGDAIVTFYPVESKEKVLQIDIYSICWQQIFIIYSKYVYLIGQLIGTIDFFKGFLLNSKLNSFKMDTMLIVFKQFSAQYSLVIKYLFFVIFLCHSTIWSIKYLIKF